MCLFDVLIALDVQKIEKKRIFLYFFKFVDILPIFSDTFLRFSDTLFSGPCRYIRCDDICNIALSSHLLGINNILFPYLILFIQYKDMQRP